MEIFVLVSDEDFLEDFLNRRDRTIQTDYFVVHNRLDIFLWNKGAQHVKEPLILFLLMTKAFWTHNEEALTHREKNRNL